MRLLLISVSSTVHIRGVTFISTVVLLSFTVHTALPLIAGWSGESSLKLNFSCSRLSILATAWELKLYGELTMATICFSPFVKAMVWVSVESVQVVLASSCPPGE